MHVFVHKHVKERSNESNFLNMVHCSSLQLFKRPFAIKLLRSKTVGLEQFQMLKASQWSKSITCAFAIGAHQRKLDWPTKNCIDGYNFCNNLICDNGFAYIKPISLHNRGDNEKEIPDSHSGPQFVQPNAPYSIYLYATCPVNIFMLLKFEEERFSLETNDTKEEQKEKPKEFKEKETCVIKGIG